MSRPELADAVNTALDRLYPGRDPAGIDGLRILKAVTDRRARRGCG
jgi:hypothetical protein